MTITNSNVPAGRKMIWFSQDGSHTLVDLDTGRERPLSPGGYRGILRDLENRDPQAAAEMQGMDALIAGSLARKRNDPAAAMLADAIYTAAKRAAAGHQRPRWVTGRNTSIGLGVEVTT